MDTNTKNKNSATQSTHEYPPVVSVLGHVDHGKTTLLDAIRKTNIATREAGGITQKIGASEIEVMHDGKKRKITFIDTPGHEAFSNMRSHGVNASDIALLIVASNDGVKPQTQESIKKILESKLPFIVVFTKADLPEANVERAKQQVIAEGVALEGLGGDTPFIAVSAKSGEKIHDLLDLILLIYDLFPTKKSEQDTFLGVVIESKLDKKRGVVATIVIKDGRLAVGEKIYRGTFEAGKIRALINTLGKNVNTAVAGDAVEILGITEILPAGTLLSLQGQSLPAEKTPAEVAFSAPHDLANFFSNVKKDTLPIILKTEASGELEAIKNSLPDKVEVVFEGQGDISVSDVLLAKDFGALILGFNVKIDKDAQALAETERAFYRIYSIIYELLDEVKDALAALQEGKKPLGKSQVIASFDSSGGKILGIKVTEGRISMGDKISLIRREKEIGKSRVISLKRGKQDVKEVAKGLECGIQISPQLDFEIGDMLLSHNTKS